MRIGILTFHSVNNYGAVLQAYALQTYISSLGHEVEIIDYRPTYFHGARKWSLRPGRLANNIASAMAERRFESFRRDFIHRTAVCRDKKDLGTKLPVYDAVVVGSDQVWSPDVDRRKETDPIYFFDWDIPNKTRKIAYAASFGTDEISERHREATSAGIKNVDFISVREPSGVRIVKQLSGHNAQWVCDPVFLLSVNEWCGRLGIDDDLPTGDEYVCYMPPSPDLVRGFAAAEGRQVVCLGWNPVYALSRNLSCAIPTPLQWIKRISRAKGVITQSFHGTAFSIILHKPFVYVCPSGARKSRAARITSLLGRLGLEGRMISQEDADPERISMLFSDQTDWKAVDEKLNEFRQESFRFLASNL